MKITEEEVNQDPIIKIYEDLQKILRGKTVIDYKDEYETTFGIILNSIVELKFKKEANDLILRFYREPEENQKLTLTDKEFFIDYSRILDHIFIENSENISTLFSFKKVLPNSTIEKIILQNHYIESYKDLLNFGYAIFKDCFEYK